MSLHRTILLSITLVLVSHTQNAHAITISIDSVELLPANAATQSNPGPNNQYSTFASAINITNAGESTPEFIGAVANASTRYTFSQTSHNGDLVNDINFITTSSIKIIFTVSPSFPLETYDLTIDSKLNASAYTRISGATSLVNGTGALLSPSLSLSTSLDSYSPRSFAGSTGSRFLESNRPSDTIFGLTGTHQFELSYTWNNITRALAGPSSDAVLLSGMDPQMNPLIPDYDSYANQAFFGRDPSSDGQFVNISAKVTYVPEVPAILLSSIPVFLFGGLIRIRLGCKWR